MREAIAWLCRNNTVYTKAGVELDEEALDMLPDDGTFLGAQVLEEAAMAGHHPTPVVVVLPRPGEGGWRPPREEGRLGWRGTTVRWSLRRTTSSV